MEKQIRLTRFLFLILSVAFFYSCEKDHLKPEDNCKNKDPYELRGDKHFLDGYEPLSTDGMINVVVEIPAGTNDKWEVDKVTGYMRWEIKDGIPRVVKYLGYPCNYGIIPQTLLSKETGGDGDPLDVLVLGPAVERGSIVKCRLIGILYLTDSEEQDDKLIAIIENSPLSSIETIDQLNESFPGVTDIIQIWFSNYKGSGIMKANGFGNEIIAQTILNKAIEAYNN